MHQTGILRYASGASVILALLLPAALESQTVVGKVVEEGTGRPVRNAFVRLLDEQGATRAGTLADSLGLFSMRAPAAGSYSVQAEQIGYVSGHTALLDLQPDGTQRHTLTLRVQAVVLDEITASTRTRCRIRPESGPGTQRLWNEARKALDVAAWGVRAGRLQFEIATFRRQFDRSMRPVSVSIPDTASSTGPRPFVTLPAADLTSDGYIQPSGSADGYVFYAPDAEVLVSDVFLSNHCFWVETPSSARHEGMIGLAFEPLRSQTVSDITGVLWLDARTSELQHLEYSYTRLPWEMPDGAADGVVEFRRIPGGAWITQRWSIRIPHVVFAPAPTPALNPLRGAAPTGPRYQHTGFDEAGGHVRSLRTASGVRRR